MAWARTSFRSGAEKARQIPKRPPAVSPELSFESEGGAIPSTWLFPTVAGVPLTDCTDLASSDGFLFLCTLATGWVQYNRNIL
jgi:hypothetical protein